MEIEQPLAVALQLTVATLGLFYLIREIFLFSQRKTKWWPLQPSRVPTLPVDPLALLALMAVIGIAIWSGMILLIPFIVIGAIFFFTRLTGRSYSRLWQFHRFEGIHSMSLAIQTYLVLLIPLGLLSLASFEVLSYFGIEDDPQEAVQLFLDAETLGDRFLLMIYAVVFAPVTEELFFRGFLYPILKGWTGRNLAILISAVLFGLSHVHAMSFLPLCFFGAILGLVYDQTGKLGNAMVLHALFNFVTCTVILSEIYA